VSDIGVPPQPRNRIVVATRSEPRRKEVLLYIADERVARMSAAICGDGPSPGCRCAHPGYAC
jgi:hypothetical protein